MVWYSVPQSATELGHDFVVTNVGFGGRSFVAVGNLGCTVEPNRREPATVDHEEKTFRWSGNNGPDGDIIARWSEQHSR